MADNEPESVEKTPSLPMRVFEAINRDGTLKAAWRQGADEAATALKAFPESIQIDEPGTILSPTQGEIASDRESSLPTPSEIAKSKSLYGPEQTQSNDQDHGRSRGR
jgi:hypothetical protein